MPEPFKQLDDLAELVGRLRDQPDDRPGWLAQLQARTTDAADFAPYFRFFYELARRFERCTVLEVGTFKGTAAAHLAGAGPDVHVTTLDIDPQAKSLADALGLPNVHAVTADSIAYAPDRVPIDILFLDGVARCAQVYSEYLRYRPLMRDGGLIFFDDLDVTDDMKRLWPLIPDEKRRLDYLHYTGFGVARVDHTWTHYGQLDGPARILIKFPTRSRPGRFLRTLDRWRRLLSGQHHVLFLVTIDADDTTMNNPAMRSTLGAMGDVMLHVGPHRSKIEACNGGLAGRVFDILILASDDMTPQAPGYDALIARHMREAFPSLDGALHYHDQNCRDRRLITVSVMGRALYQQLGYVYHPDYNSLFCDNEFTDVVRGLGKCVDAPGIVFRHDHVGRRPDALYRRNDTFHADRAVYLRRKAAGFPRESVSTVTPTADAPERPQLSILIASLRSRAASLRRLLAALEAQRAGLPRPDSVEILVDVDDRQKPVGRKRNDLLARARGAYCAYIDDDDRVAPSYLTEILEALDRHPQPDCVVFEGLMTTDGNNARRFLFGTEFGRDHEQGGVYYRLPNHLCPVRRELATRTRFPEVNFGEDADYARRLLPLLKSQAKVPATLYYYQFSTRGTETQKPRAVVRR